MRIYGFRQGQCTEDIVSWLVLVQQKSFKWVKKSVAVAVMDIFTAFDQTKHEEMYEVVDKRGMDPYALLGMLRG